MAARKGATLVEFRQGFRSITAPTRELENASLGEKERRLQCAGDRRAGDDSEGLAPTGPRAGFDTVHDVSFHRWNPLGSRLNPGES